MGELFEIRDYHYDGDLDEYKRWWETGRGVLGARMDIVGLWFDSGEPPRISGSDPMPLPHGSANCTWIIRWDDIEHRERVWDALQTDPDWVVCAEEHPGFGNYRNMSVRFMETV